MVGDCARHFVDGKRAISTLKLSLLSAGLTLLCLASPAAAQSAPDVLLDSSPQVFAVLCAARAAGVNVAPGAGEVAARVEAAMARLPAEVTSPLRDYFESRRLQRGSAGEEVSPYLSAALLMGPPPDFRYGLPRDQLPPDVWDLEEFPGLLRDFYARAGVERLWREARSADERAIAERQSEVAQELLRARGYLRLIGESYAGRSYVVYLETALPTGLVSARKYGEQYFLVLAPQRNDVAVRVRHQYLHYLLDSISAKHAGAYTEWAKLLPLVRNAPRLPVDFRNDVYWLATESLVQAVELRLRKLSDADALAGLEAAERSGHIFTRFFYDALADFERSEPSIAIYFPELLREFDLASERARLKRVDFGAREPVAPHGEAAAISDTPRRLLAEAETYLAASNYAAARQRFERVLADWDPDEPRALFGLALVASAERDRDAARRYFQLALERARDPRILGWSHIYLGRIYDLEGDRPQAVAHYQAALALHSQLDRVEQAARRGLEQPFGEEDSSDNRRP
jgi:tetratricopeptide (TPR) repeat protein